MIKFIKNKISSLPYFGLVHFHEGFKMRAYGKCIESEYFWSKILRKNFDWEKKERLLLIRILGNFNAFIDIGANSGYYSLLAASAGVKRVISFEPESKNYQILIRNIYLNKLDNIVALPVGVGPKVEMLDFYVGDDFDHRYSNSFSLNFVQNLYKKAYKKNVMVLPFDMFSDIIGGNSIIKIDVEGFERQVLIGMKNFLAQFKPVILLETDDADLILNLMDEYGYKSHSFSDGKESVKNYLLYQDDAIFNLALVS